MSEFERLLDEYRSAVYARRPGAAADARIALLAHHERVANERDRAIAACQGYAHEIAERDARIAELEPDAERYRRLRANAQWMYPSSEGSDQKHAYLTVTGYGDCFHDPRAGEIVDAAVDTARKS